MAYSGTGKPVFKIYTSADVHVEDFTLTCLTSRKKKPVRVAHKYETIFTRTLVDSFIGYRFVWELAFTWQDVYGDIDDYSTVIDTDITKLQKIQSYFDAGYKVYFVPHADAEAAPYNQIFQVECEVSDQDIAQGGTVFSDHWVMTCTTVDVVDTINITYAIDYVVDEAADRVVDESGNRLIG